MLYIGSMAEPVTIDLIHLHSLTEGYDSRLSFLRGEELVAAVLKARDGQLTAVPSEGFEPLACLKAIMRWQLTAEGRRWFEGTWACTTPEGHYVTWAAGLLFEPYGTYGDEVIFRYNPGFYLEEAA